MSSSPYMSYEQEPIKLGPIGKVVVGLLLCLCAVVLLAFVRGMFGTTVAVVVGVVFAMIAVFVYRANPDPSKGSESSPFAYKESERDEKDIALDRKLDAGQDAFNLVNSFESVFGNDG
jgi:hypothetical protein